METSTKVLMGIAGFILFIAICAGIISFISVEEGSSSNTGQPTTEQPMF